MMTSSVNNEHTRNGLCALTSCHFTIHASCAMIILPYTRITRYRCAMSTDDTGGGRAQRLSGFYFYGFDPIARETFSQYYQKNPYSFRKVHTSHTNCENYVTIRKLRSQDCLRYVIRFVFAFT